MTITSGIAATENLSERATAFARETGAWLSGNSLDILIAAGAAVLVVLVLLGLRAFGQRLIGQAESIQWRVVLGRVLAKTSLFFIIACALELVAENAETPPALLRAINIAFTVAAAIQAAVWARELILGFVQHRAGGQGDDQRLGSALGIIRLLVTIALFAIAIIVILDNLGVNVTGLVAGLGIGGIAIGLAAQGIFKDLFAALSIIFDKPFRKGDGVKFDQVNGSVEQIGLKTTRIRALSGEEIVVSNAMLLDKQIHNFANLDHRRIVLIFGITYETPVAVLRKVPELCRAVVERHEHARLVRCGLVNFAASSLDHELQFDIHSADYEYVFSTKAAIMLELLEAFAAESIALAYPTQVSYTAAPDGRLILPYPEVQKVDAHLDRGR